MIFTIAPWSSRPDRVQSAPVADSFRFILVALDRVGEQVTVQSKVTTILQASQSALNATKAKPQVLGSGQNPFLAADTLARA